MSRASVATASAGNAYGALPGGASAAAVHTPGPGAAPSNSYGALPGAPSSHASEYGSTPTGADVDAPASPSSSYGQLPTGGPAPAPTTPGRVLTLPTLPPGGRPSTPPGTPLRRQPPPNTTGAGGRGSPRLGPQRNLEPMSPMRSPPAPARHQPPSVAASPQRMPGASPMRLPPRGPPAEPEEPPIGAFALDHMPPAQMDDFSRSAPPAPLGTDSETMAALNARKLRTAERATIDQQPWYFGAIAREDAAALITNLAPGAFVVRTSSQPNSFALTFKHKSGEIQHGLLRESAQGWSIENAPPFEVTLETLLKTHNGLNYNLVAQVRNAYSQRHGGGGGGGALPPAPLVAQDEYPVPENLLAGSAAPAPSPRAPFGAPQRLGGPPHIAMSPGRGPPPLVTNRSSPNLNPAAGDAGLLLQQRAQSGGGSHKVCEICNIGRAVSRVKISGANDLKLCCGNCLDMHIASPLRAQLAERKMAIDVIERQFANRPKDKVALHQITQIGLDITSLEEQLATLANRK